ncbi:hypothetical protein [Paracoccus sp. N5]|uniref:hypothetical protein n=1 Tax=Paracoccus sp. N5 TaxID=1101189 RepID=UPI0012FA4417|nr:hypothetical protein [Paracoccus sp. N5]
MVRAPAKSCPALFRLFGDAEASMIAAFLQMRVFDKLTWLVDYYFDPDETDGNVPAAAMLREQRKEKLSPLETEAARIVTMSSDRGQFALDGLVRSKLTTEQKREFEGQRDALARSLWAYLKEPMLFEAAENTLHLRLYRRYDATTRRSWSRLWKTARLMSPHQRWTPCWTICGIGSIGVTGMKSTGSLFPRTAMCPPRSCTLWFTRKPPPVCGNSTTTGSARQCISAHQGKS